AVVVAPTHRVEIEEIASWSEPGRSPAFQGWNEMKILIVDDSGNCFIDCMQESECCSGAVFRIPIERLIEIKPRSTQILNFSWHGRFALRPRLVFSTRVSFRQRRNLVRQGDGQ